MLKFLGKRLLALIPIFFGVTIITYGLMYLSPSDPITMMLEAKGAVVNPELVEEMREQAGLDQPFIVQYANWLKDILLHFDFGTSYQSGEPVLTRMLTALPNTLKLAFGSMIVTVVISIPLGFVAATHQDGILDIVIRVLTFIGTALPNFFLSLMLIYVFALKLEWLPVLASGTWKGLILPIVTLSVAMISKYVRQIRVIVLDELEKEYVIGARSRGLRESTIMYKNVLKNAMIPIVTLIALSIGSLLGGTAIVENIFVYPGLGKMVLDAINFRDYTVIQGFVVWISMIFVLINLLTDLTYGLLDPRVKVGQKGR